MSSLKEKQREIRELESKEEELIEALAFSVARLESLNNEQTLDQKQRDRLKDRKESGKVYDEEKLKALNEDVRSQRVALENVRKRKRERQGWLKKTRISLCRRRRELRSLARPRIIDLDLEFRPMTIQGPVDKVIGHYTAGPVDEDTEDSIRLCKQYHAAHLAQGWSGEAYMVNFTSDGNILVLRPAMYVGAHTLGFNTGSYGIMVHGTTGDTATKAQKRAMRWWAKNGHKKIMGKAQTTVRPADLPWKGHNDYNATGCPGDFKPTFVSKGVQ